MPSNDIAPSDLGQWTGKEIDTQPASWRRARDLASSVAPILGADAARLVMVGCGTSYYIGGAFAALREQAGLGETDAFIASQLPSARRYDRLIGLTRSGTTADLVRALREIPAHIARTVVTADPHSPAAEAADDVIDLSFADEQSVVQTRFATTTLAMLRATLGEDIEPIAEQAEQSLASQLPDVDRYERVVFLGHGWASWLAAEAALKVREMAGAAVESYLAEEYEHGPISAASERTLVWGLGPLSQQVQECVARTGATTVVSSRDPMAELVRVHRFGLELARHAGINCDRPPFLRRSVA